MVAAAVVAGATAVGAIVTSSNSKSAAKTATKAASDASAADRAVAQEQYAKNEAHLTPYMERGNTAGTTLQGLLGLGDAAASKQSMDTWLGSTDYNFVTDQGQKAVVGQRATQGLVHSGQTLKDLIRFGEGTGRQYESQYEAMLAGQQQTGLGAASALTGAGQAFVNTTTNANDSAASAAGNAAIASANATNQAINSGIGSLAYFAGSRPSSYSAPKLSSPSGGGYGGETIWPQITGASPVLRPPLTLGL
jgi:hypothetical protein